MLCPMFVVSPSAVGTDGTKVSDHLPEKKQKGVEEALEVLASSRPYRRVMGSCNSRSLPVLGEKEKEKKL